MRYEVEFLGQTYSTTNSMLAARVFVRRLREGAEPTGWAICPVGGSVSVRRVPGFEPNVKKMQRLFVTIGK